MSDSRSTTLPGPTPDVDSAPYWDGLREHRFMVQCCASCARRRFPPTPSCPYCAAPEFAWQQAEGTGTVYSFITVHRTFDPAFADEVPYDIATIDLDGGGRMAARVDSDARIDARVISRFVDHGSWTELRFVLS